MYKGFNLSTSGWDDHYKDGLKIYENQKQAVFDELDNFIGVNGTIDGSRLQKHWFPSVKADIFLSHSHKDKKNAIGLAAVLKKYFNLNVFIDSCIWGNYQDLLRKIDKKYCYDPDRKAYDYDIRNISTCHVHLMLSTALSTMMDRTECLIFLNTPSSVSTKTDIEEKTSSPWLYSEIAISGLLKSKEPDRNKKQTMVESAKSLALDSAPEFEYTLFNEHLIKINNADFISWYDEEPCNNNSLEVLDSFYKCFHG